MASRRGLLRGGLAMSLAGLAAAWRPTPSVAVEDDPRCPKGEGAISNKQCVLLNCEGAAPCGGVPGPVGFCARTVSGARDCVPFSGLTDCPTTDECDSDADCPGSGQVCIKVGACCCTKRTPHGRHCKRHNKCVTACADTP
jgi:hypothetical protein